MFIAVRGSHATRAARVINNPPPAEDLIQEMKGVRDFFWTKMKGSIVYGYVNAILVSFIFLSSLHGATSK
jgi:hypothetical protein